MSNPFQTPGLRGTGLATRVRTTPFVESAGPASAFAAWTLRSDSRALPSAAGPLPKLPRGVTNTPKDVGSVRASSRQYDEAFSVPSPLQPPAWCASLKHTAGERGGSWLRWVRGAAPRGSHQLALPAAPSGSHSNATVAALPGRRGQGSPSPHPHSCLQSQTTGLPNVYLPTRPWFCKTPVEVSLLLYQVSQSRGGRACQDEAPEAPNSGRRREPGDSGVGSEQSPPPRSCSVRNSRVPVSPLNREPEPLGPWIPGGRGAAESGVGSELLGNGVVLSDPPRRPHPGPLRWPQRAWTRPAEAPSDPDSKAPQCGTREDLGFLRMGRLGPPERARRGGKGIARGVRTGVDPLGSCAHRGQPWAPGSPLWARARIWIAPRDSARTGVSPRAPGSPPGLLRAPGRPPGLRPARLPPSDLRKVAIASRPRPAPLAPANAARAPRGRRAPNGGGKRAGRSGPGPRLGEGQLGRRGAGRRAGPGPVAGLSACHGPVPALPSRRRAAKSANARGHPPSPRHLPSPRPYNPPRARPPAPPPCPRPAARAPAARAHRGAARARTPTPGVRAAAGRAGSQESASRTPAPPAGRPGGRRQPAGALGAARGGSGRGEALPRVRCGWAPCGSRGSDFASQPLLPDQGEGNQDAAATARESRGPPAAVAWPAPPTLLGPRLHQEPTGARPRNPLLYSRRLPARASPACLLGRSLQGTEGGKWWDGDGEEEEKEDGGDGGNDGDGDSNDGDSNDDGGDGDIDGGGGGGGDDDGGQRMKMRVTAPPASAPIPFPMTGAGGSGQLNGASEMEA
ncbi:collagen alpha-1(I) chain-like [Dipodomys merriami]|uniref:collagen alpha-1(I) chain-like n=1 Tax=Dipodomys merriami TaxID=94247 RepID=UPI003855CB71